MPELIPYLSFDGNCAEAMRFYERVLKGRLIALLTNAQTPMADQTPEADKDRIMHAYLSFEGGSLYAGDAPSGQFQPTKGVNFTLTYPTVDEARPVFEALAEGGQVAWGFEKTFWAEGAGMLVDRFGTPWIINGGMTPMQQ
jgi:PhnB protein